MGVFMAIGFAALTMTSQATFLSNWFVRKRGMAIGVAASGIGLGILLLVPWTQWLIAAYGSRSALFILAGVLAFIVAPVNFLFQRQRPEEMNLKPDFGRTGNISVDEVKVKTTPGLTLREALRDWRFWSFALGVLAGAIPLHMVLIHQVAAVSDAGFSKESAAWALGLIGLFTAPAMIGMGLLADRIGRRLAYALGSGAFMIGIFFLMAVNAMSGIWFSMLFHRSSRSAFHRANRSTRRSRRICFMANPSARSSVLSLCSSVPAPEIGPWLGGLIFDSTGGYYWAFCVAQVMALASVVFIWLAGSSRATERFV